jgi:Na+/H+ antiporter NhaD/arsenite permease-like protein
MDTFVLLVFGFVYLGMILGGIPGLALDRTGVALLGVIALIAGERITLPEVSASVDLPTMALLFGLMVISAQFRMSGFYSQIVKRMGAGEISPQRLLILLIVMVGALSALLANDIVCLAVAPVLVEGCARRRLDPKPFLLALACAANIGSAATLIGNPQNILVGQVLRLSFSGYLLDALVPSILGLAVVWLVICWKTAGRWQLATEVPSIETPSYNTWQTTKGIMVIGALVLAFLFVAVPREILALAAAGILLCSRRMRSREMLGLVDWQLLLLFLSLFVINYSLEISGNLGHLKSTLVAAGIHLDRPAWLFGSSVVLSNLVSNVPAVMLLLPSASHPMAGPILALSSTFAGNLLIVGSIANIIVVDQASRLGIRISWWEHARIGIPVTLATLAIAAAWLWVRGA